MSDLCRQCAIRWPSRLSAPSRPGVGEGPILPCAIPRYDVIRLSMTFHMNATTRRHFARRLEEERANLTATVRDLERESALDVVEAEPERLQMKDAPSDAEMAEAATSLEMARLRDIDAALLRLREFPATFGLCITCGHPIPEARLEMVPWAQRCATHAVEQSEARRAEIKAATEARD